MTGLDDLEKAFEHQEKVEREIDEYWMPMLREAKHPCPKIIESRYCDLIRKLSRSITLDRIRCYAELSDIQETFPLGINPGQDWDCLRDLADILYLARYGGFLGNEMERLTAIGESHSRSQREKSKKPRRPRLPKDLSEQFSNLRASGIARPEAIKRLALMHHVTADSVRKKLRTKDKN